MAPTGTLPPTAELRRARTAVGACFFVNAVLYANLIPRFPEVKAALGLSNSALGLALAALPLGALLAGLSSAPLIRRFGSARVASMGLTLLAAAIWAAAAAPNWAVLAGALLLAGALDAVVDVAQNADGLGIPVPLHLGVVAIVFGVPALLGPRALLSGPDDADREDVATAAGAGQ